MSQSVLDKEKSNNQDNSNAINDQVDTPQSDVSATDTTSSVGKRFADTSSIKTETSTIRKYLPLICVSLGILIFISIFSTAFALANINSNKIVKGVSVNGINLAGLTLDEASQKLSDEFSKKLNSTLTLNLRRLQVRINPNTRYRCFL